MKVAEEKEDWMQKKWRPMMAVMYMMVCVFDFILFPIMFTAVQFWEIEAANDAFRQWNPITLGGGGLFHVAMGAVLGVSAWSRGQEKIAGAAANSNAAASPALTQATSSVTVPAPAPVAQERPTTLYSAAVEQPSVVSGYKGKAGPSQENQPLI
jgi:hypothetical protein